MTKGQVLQQYRTMSAEDRHTFDRWLKANAVLGSIVAGGLFAMAMAGGSGFGPGQAVAQSAEASEISEAQTPSASNEPLSVHELTIRIAPDLPVQQVDEPF